MKTIVVKTEKVIAHEADGMPKIEIINQKISPEMTFNKFVKYLPNQNYKSATVIKVLEDGKEVNEIAKYQSIVDGSLRAKLEPGEAIDYKALAEKQSSQLTEALNRIAALEDSKQHTPVQSGSRSLMEQRAKDLGISFRFNIGDDKLLAKIKEVDKDFEV